MKTMTHKCDNCGWSGPLSDMKHLLHEIPDLAALVTRLDPGGIVPSGTCPKCEALCYPTVGRCVAADEMLAALEQCLEPLQTAWSVTRDFGAKCALADAKAAIIKAGGSDE